MNLDRIIRCLSKRKQRATYSAVSGICGGSARNLMSGRPKDPLNSWVVAKRTGLPSGYRPSQMAPEVGKKDGLVISDARELRKWLNDHCPDDDE